MGTTPMWRWRLGGAARQAAVRAVAAAACLPLAPTAVLAQRWQASAALASDKVQRGISQSEGRPAWLLDIGRHTDTGWGLAAGLAGPVYQAQGGRAEVTLGVSRSWQVDDDWLLLAAATHYGYVGEARARAHRYQEASVGLGWRGRVSATLAVAPNASAYYVGGRLPSGRAAAFELTAHQRLAGRLALDVGLGWQDLGGLQLASYRYGSVALGWGFGPVQATLSYIDSNSPSARAGPRWVGTVAWGF